MNETQSRPAGLSGIALLILTVRRSLDWLLLDVHLKEKRKNLHFTIILQVYLAVNHIAAITHNICQTNRIAHRRVT